MNRRTLASIMFSSGNLLATLVLLDLRVAGTIAWSWWWIFAPMWLPIAITGLAFTALAALERFE